MGQLRRHGVCGPPGCSSEMNIQFVEDGNYHRVKYTGLRTLPAILEMLGKVDETACATGVYRVLFDLRESEEGFSVVDKYELGVYLANLFSSKYTVAVVIRKEHITGFLEQVAHNRGAARFIESDDEAFALRWLRENEGSGAGRGI